MDSSARRKQSLGLNEPTMKTCRHARDYKAIRAPKCGCDACERKYVARIARNIWHHRLDATEGEHTVRRVLQLAHVLPAR